MKLKLKRDNINNQQENMTLKLRESATENMILKLRRHKMKLKQSNQQEHELHQLFN